MQNLKFRYPGSALSLPWVVDVQHLSIAPGEQILLTGASGRGKSTLLQLIAGLIDPDEGEIFINSQNIAHLTGSKRDLFRGSRVGMIFQTFNLLRGFSAKENILAALLFSSIPKKEHNSRALELLQTVGIETPDREVSQLSIGQQQRVAVARAIAGSPTVILADEPTGNLDSKNAEAVMALFDKLHLEGATIIMVTHEPRYANRAQRRIEMHDGHVVTDAAVDKATVSAS